MAESSPLLRDICAWNPFTQATEAIRFGLYGKFPPEAALWLMVYLAVFLALCLIEVRHLRNRTRAEQPAR